MNGLQIGLLVAAVWAGAALLVGGLYALVRWIDTVPEGSPWRGRLRGLALLLILAVFVVGTIGGVSRLARRIREWQGPGVGPVEPERRGY